MGKGLISDDVINQIRDRVDTEIVGQHVALTRAGQNLKGLCPFHQEKSLPSPSAHRGRFSTVSAAGPAAMCIRFDEINRSGLPRNRSGFGAQSGVDVPESTGGVSNEARTQLGRLERLNAAVEPGISAC